MHLRGLKECIFDYVVTVDELYGHYLDSTSGFDAIARSFGKIKSESVLDSPDGNVNDESAFFIGRGSPNDPTNRMLHRTTVGEFKKRNARGGHNHVRAAQLLVVLIYEYWNSEHRANIAASLNLKNQKELKVPYIGDLRLLRNDVIHHRGILQKKTVRKLEVISGLSAGCELTLDGEAVESMVREVKSAMDEIVVKTGAPDPEHRKIWHVR